jgi:hypothetical protein
MPFSLPAYMCPPYAGGPAGPYAIIGGAPRYAAHARMGAITDNARAYTASWAARQVLESVPVHDLIYSSLRTAPREQIWAAIQQLLSVIGTERQFGRPVTSLMQRIYALQALDIVRSAETAAQAGLSLETRAHLVQSLQTAAQNYQPYTADGDALLRETALAVQQATPYIRGGMHRIGQIHALHRVGPTSLPVGAIVQANTEVALRAFPAVSGAIIANLPRFTNATVLGSPAGAPVVSRTGWARIQTQGLLLGYVPTYAFTVIGQPEDPTGVLDVNVTPRMGW